MIEEHQDENTGGLIRLIHEESDFNLDYFTNENNDLLAVLWNRGKDQEIQVDDQRLKFPGNSMMVLISNQSFKLEDSIDVVGWQFNRGFYCIIDHDEEVSCVGLLFYGSTGIPVITLDDKEQRSFDLLLGVFKEEIAEDDNLKTEMLRMLLKRLIVKLTRLFKSQNQLESVDSNELDIVRQFNLLVEQNYQKFHQVQDYADLLYRSPKTISNIFSKYSSKTPLEVIHERIVLEVKRLLLYTDKSAKEIAHEVGFYEIPNFSRFFKKHTQFSPSQFRENFRKALQNN